MFAKSGDHIVVHGLHVGETSRSGIVLEARGADGGPPYLVRWIDDEHDSLVFPGPGAATITPATG